MKKKLLILAIFCSIFSLGQQRILLLGQQGATNYVAYGLSSEIKPAFPPDGSYFFETNTGKTYKSFGNSWFLVSIGVDSTAHLLKIKTDSVAMALALYTDSVAAAREVFVLGRLRDTSVSIRSAIILKQNLGITASAILDFPSTDKGRSSDLTIALTGAVVGKVVVLGVPTGSVIANTDYTAWVSAANIVTLFDSTIIQLLIT